MLLYQKPGDNERRRDDSIVFLVSRSRCYDVQTARIFSPFFQNRHQVIRNTSETYVFFFFLSHARFNTRFRDGRLEKETCRVERALSKSREGAASGSRNPGLLKSRGLRLLRFVFCADPFDSIALWRELAEKDRRRRLRVTRGNEGVCSRVADHRKSGVMWLRDTRSVPGHLGDVSTSLKIPYLAGE